MTKTKLAHSFTVVISAQDFQDKITAKLEEVRKEAKIQGFRPGQAPMNLIKTKYENAVKGEVLDDLIQERATKTLEENKVRPALRPKIELTTFEDGKDIEFKMDVEALPEIKPADLTKLEVKKLVATATDKEINAALEKLANAKKTTVPCDEKRETKTDDVIVIDFTGTIDGEEFKGGKGKDYYLALGSNTFIPGFEEQLTGKNIGEEVDVNVTFPEQYHAADLAGKPALFKVKINDVTTKELPKLDDEFASDVSEFETLAEYKEDLKKQLEEKKAQEAKREQEDEAIAAIVEASEMEIPEAMIQTQCEDMVNEFAQRIAQSGLTMEQYMQFSGQTVQGLMDQVRPEAETRIKTSLVLEAIVKAEGIEATDADVDAEIEKMAGMYGMDVEQLKGYMGEVEKASMKNQMAITKAVEYIMENVKEKAAKKAKKEDAEEADKIVDYKKKAEELEKKLS